MKVNGESIHSGMKRPRLSLLRYPGGKSGLYPTLRALIRKNGVSKGTYIEPYAGGAGAALALLITGEVRRIVINDLDPAIWAFWRSAVKFNDEFAALLSNAEVTVEEWHRQRDIYVAGDTADVLSLGFATFYLNRTNRSGVLNGGPIGGHDQTGNYKIDARFNKDSLLERLRLLALYKRKITVLHRDGASVIREYADRDDCFTYADPPYFLKAGSLYLNSFKPSDHAALAETLNQHADSHWLLTYDDVPQIGALYPDRRRSHVALHYSAHRVVQADEALVFSDRLQVPEQLLAYQPMLAERSVE